MALGSVARGGDGLLPNWHRVRPYPQPRAQILLRVAIPLATVVCVTMAVQPIWRGLDFTITGSGPLWVAAALIPSSCVLSYVLVRRPSAFAFYLAACHPPAAIVRLATSPTPALAAPS